MLNFAMLIQAENPQVPEVEQFHWHIVNREALDGGDRDSCQVTAMHLLFTELPCPALSVPYTKVQFTASPVSPLRRPPTNSTIWTQSNVRLHTW
ncbi:hypothetical protein PG990_012099 [Apiospora arundinis]